MKIASLSLLATLLISLPTVADWKLLPNQSQVYFSTVKNETLAETHQFKTLQGSIAATGEFELAIDLTSAETGVPIRNERLGQFLFETTKFTTATGKGKIDVTKLNAQAIGASQELKIPVTFELHGKSLNKDVSLLATKSAANTVDVVTLAPVYLNAADFDLLAGVEKLKQLANLPSISPLVPVTLHLRLTQEPAKKA